MDRSSIELNMWVVLHGRWYAIFVSLSSDHFITDRREFSCATIHSHIDTYIYLWRCYSTYIPGIVTTSLLFIPPCSGTCVYGYTLCCTSSHSSASSKLTKCGNPYRVYFLQAQTPQPQHSSDRPTICNAGHEYRSLNDTNLLMPALYNERRCQVGTLHRQIESRKLRWSGYYGNSEVGFLPSTRSPRYYTYSRSTIK